MLSSRVQIPGWPNFARDANGLPLLQVAVLPWCYVTEMDIVNPSHA